MTTIFHDMVEDFVEVFMDDFSIFGKYFEVSLRNLDKILSRCEDTNLVLNREKCHFLLERGQCCDTKCLTLCQRLKRPWQNSLRNFPSHFYKRGASFSWLCIFFWRLIKDFSKIARPICSLLEKEVKFDFDLICLKDFKMFKRT